MYEVVFQCFETIVETSKNWDSETLIKAKGFISCLENFEMLVSFVVTKNCLRYLKQITVSLQQRSRDILSAYTEIQTVKSCLQDMRNEPEGYFEVMMEEAKYLAERIGSEPSVPRQCKRQTLRNNTPATSLIEYYKRSVPIPLLDHLLNELNSRFSKHSRLVSQSFLLTPQVLVISKTPDLPPGLQELSQILNSRSSFLKMKCKKCGADVAPSNKFCGQCGQKVEIDDHEGKIKNCPSCNSLQKLTQKFCTDCGFEIENVICQAQTDKGPCGNVLPPNSKFCGVCGNSASVENKTPDSKQDSSVEDKMQDKTQDSTQDSSVKDKTPDSTQDSSIEGKTPDRTQDNTHDSTQDDELDGGHGSKQKQFKIIQDSKNPERNFEVETVLKLNSDDPSKSEEVIPMESKVRGLAVICTHTTFKKNPVKLSERPSGNRDKEIMEDIWKLYDDCEVLTFLDKTSSFYDTELEKKIQEKLMEMPTVKYFVFVLSTHGDERPEKEKDGNLHYQHYFYTKDGQFKTQDLMTKINDIEKIDERMKLFFIQACRSRATNTELDNQDTGFTVKITSTINKQISIQQSESTDIADTIGHMTSEKDNEFSSITIENDEVHHHLEKLSINTGSIDVADAKGYMPPPEEDNDETQQSEMENEENEIMKNDTIEIPPTEGIPHCEDCVVVFASMAGKYAYSRLNDPMAGGWMIRALHSTLEKYQGGDTVHILDILRDINRDISEKYKLTPLDSSERCRSHLCILKDELDRELMTENYCEKSLDDLNELSKKLDHLQENLEQKMESEWKEIRDEIIEVTASVEKIVGLVVLKAQSCFFHNLAFQDEEMTLHKTKIT
ncbi:unnamed protein product [Mytilus coruscus]|uniref:Caspase family p20 domain-containing protein n=1 Tax=Mytilus coruscus TaxID=42192 RepID=A0A6J8EG03_MYTCO|nr:unnamed protein product [Mytilus coruscus]